MNKVMLIYPPGKAYQRGEDRAQCNIDDSAATSVHACNDLGYAAAILRNSGYEVFLRDYQTEKTDINEIERDVKNFLPDIIVISITNATILSDIDFVNRILEYHKCEIILKGAAFFNIPEELLETLDLHNVNYLIGGEMDTVIGKLVDNILKGEGNLKDIPGIIYKEGNSFIKTSFNVWETDLDDIPFPARDLMKNELYVRPDTGEPMATIQVTRGCPSQCIYCLTPMISGKIIRKRSIENIFAEISECYYKYGIKNFFFKADTFTIDHEWAEELCDRIINSDLYKKIEFTVNSRAKPLNITLLHKLKKAGCFMIAVGFESGNENTLKLIKKGTTVEDNLRAARMIKEAGLPLFGFFMIGFPWEDRNDVMNTLRFVFELDPDFAEIHVAMPFYGTELYSACEKYGTIRSESWGNDYFSPNTTGTFSIPVEELIALRKKYLLKFYLRPTYIIKKIFGAVSNPIIIKNYVIYGMRLLKNNLFKKS